MDSVLFDLDGNLWDATDPIFESWDRVLRAEKSVREPFTKAQLQNCFGKMLSEIGRILFPYLTEEESNRIIDLCSAEEIRDLRTRGGTPYPGLFETLSELKTKYRLLLVSNCQSGYIEAFLAFTGLEGMFYSHLCPGDTGEGKAENISRIVREFGLTSPVYVGDTASDYEAAKRANVPFIFASYGFGKVEGTEKIASLSELPSLLARLDFEA